MKTGAVYRQGRTRHVSDAEMEGRQQCNTVLLQILAVVVPVGLTYKLYASEQYFFDQQIAFDEVEPLVVDAPATETWPSHVTEGTLVHVAAESFTSHVADDDFGVSVEGGVSLQRHTEYCQWDEHRETRCETCTREGSDGKEESYDCNCVETYHYTKMWRPHRILSIGFDQAANHHNPMRDPFPSGSMVSRNFQAGLFHVTEEVMEAVRAPTRGLAYSYNAVPIPPSFMDNVFAFFLGEKPPIRFEDARNLRGFGVSNAHTRDNFVYTNTREGWFFSPHTEETWFRVLRGFGQFMEGSAMDWQIGDLYDMYNGCTAGDIRVNFQVADPRSLSFIGKVVGVDSTREAAAVVDVVPYVAPNGFSVAIAHAGLHHATEMFDNETEEARTVCTYARVGMLLAGFCASFLVQALLGRGGEPMGFAPRALLSLGCTQLMIGAVWCAVWGTADMGAPATAVAGSLMTGLGIFGVLDAPPAAHVHTQQKKTH